jgi:ATP-dependent Clp protease adaptor protein ClpS
MTTAEPRQLERTLLEHIPHYAVILHNDEVHSMDYVVDALLKSVPGLTSPEAIDIMLEAHSTGKGVVIVCPLEQAEHYRDRIKSFSLGCTIERA